MVIILIVGGINQQMTKKLPKSIKPEDLGKIGKTKEQWQREALEHLEDAKFNFACFVDYFKRSLENGNNK